MWFHIIEATRSPRCSPSFVRASANRFAREKNAAKFERTTVRSGFLDTISTWGNNLAARSKKAGSTRGYSIIVPRIMTSQEVLAAHPIPSLPYARPPPPLPSGHLLSRLLGCKSGRFSRPCTGPLADLLPSALLPVCPSAAKVSPVRSATYVRFRAEGVRGEEALRR